MKDRKSKRRPERTPVEEDSVVLKRELRRLGMSDAEIEQTLRKKHRQRPLEFGFVKSRRLLPAQTEGTARRVSGHEVCTVAAAADMLQVHPKTVQRFIREGRLKAKRVGRSYRILRSDLEAFAGMPASSPGGGEHPRVTSVVEIPGVGRQLARKWQRTVADATRNRDVGATLRADTVHDAEQSSLKVMAVGSPQEVIELLLRIQVWMEELG